MSECLKDKLEEVISKAVEGKSVPDSYEKLECILMLTKDIIREYLGKNYVKIEIISGDGNITSTLKSALKSHSSNVAVDWRGQVGYCRTMEVYVQGDYYDKHGHEIVDIVRQYDGYGEYKVIDSREWYNK